MGRDIAGWETVDGRWTTDDEHTTLRCADSRHERWLADAAENVWGVKREDVKRDNVQTFQRSNAPT